MESTTDNKLDSNFITTWRPLYVLQMAVGSAKVNLIGNTVTPRVWYQKLYSLVNLVLCCISILYLTKLSAFYVMDDEWSVHNALSYTQVILTLFLNNCPIIVNNFYYAESNCQLFMCLQHVDQALKISGNVRYYKKLYRFIVGYISFLFVAHVAAYICIVILNIGFREIYLAVPGIFTLMAQDLEIVSFYSTIFFLILRVSYINSLLIRCIDSRWRTLNQLESPTAISNIYRAYRKVLKVYVLIQKTTGPFLFLLCLHMFCNELLVLKEFITNGEAMSALSIYQSVTIILKLFNRILYAGIFVTHLQQQIALTRPICLRIINEITNKECHQHVKNLLRLLSETRPMSVLGVIELSSLPRQLVALTATYAVVLLQFNFQTQEQARR